MNIDSFNNQVHINEEQLARPLFNNRRESANVNRQSAKNYLNKSHVPSNQPLSLNAAAGFSKMRPSTAINPVSIDKGVTEESLDEISASDVTGWADMKDVKKIATKRTLFVKK